MFECKNLVLKFACWHFRIEILQENGFEYNNFQLQKYRTPFQDHVYSKNIHEKLFLYSKMALHYPKWPNFYKEKKVQI